MIFQLHIISGKFLQNSIYGYKSNFAFQVYEIILMHGLLTSIM